MLCWASQVVKNLTANVRDIKDVGSIPGWGKSPGRGNGNLPQYSCLENPMDRGAWWALVHRVAKSQTPLKWFRTHAHMLCLIKVLLKTLNQMLLFRHWAISDSLQCHGLPHSRLPCPSLSPGVCSDSCAWSPWCYLTISSSATLFSFCCQSFPALGSFPMSRLFALGGQSIGALASAISPSSEYSGLISFRIDRFDPLQSEGLSRIFSSTTIWKHQFLDIENPNTLEQKGSSATTPSHFWKHFDL